MNSPEVPPHSITKDKQDTGTWKRLCGDPEGLCSSLPAGVSCFVTPGLRETSGMGHLFGPSASSVPPFLRWLALKIGLAAMLVAGNGLQGQTPLASGAPVDLPVLYITGFEMAVETPALNYEQPISVLRLDPRVDLQVRNLPEGQGDVTIRGGIFENTGFKLGAATLFDPQTGHYFAEIPLPPSFLEQPEILTGFANAAYGFNSTVGTIDYGFAASVAPGVSATAGVGEHDFNMQSLRIGWTPEAAAPRWLPAVELEWARSESDGTIDRGDHDFERVAGRLFWSDTAGGETSLIAGYQDKFFGWPNLYTPFGFNETEDLETTLLVLDHRRSLPVGDLNVTAYYRKHRDHYTLSRDNPQLFEAFHESEVRAIAAEYRGQVRGLEFGAFGQITDDSLETTNLDFGEFLERTWLKLSAYAGPRFAVGRKGAMALQAGVSLDTTSRDSGEVSPLLRTTYERPWRGGTLSGHFSATRTVQRPGYTAIGASPAGGLFRGNADLGVEESRNFEAGLRWENTRLALGATFFYREDRNLVDWVFRGPFDASKVGAARFAENVDVDVFGLELLSRILVGERTELNFGYTWLDKNEDFGIEDVFGSFYALNYARHRFSLAAAIRLSDWAVLDVDQELRFQRENPLRSGGDEAYLVNLALEIFVSPIEGLSLKLVAENLTADDFQDIPAVPGAGRQLSFLAHYRF